MKLDSLSTKSLEPIFAYLKRYRVMLFLLLFAGLYVYLLYTIGQLTSATPTAADVSSEQSTVKRLRVDEDAVQSMLKLREENVEIQTLFNEARNNPFAE